MLKDNNFKITLKSFVDASWAISRELIFILEHNDDKSNN